MLCTTTPPLDGSREAPEARRRGTVDGSSAESNYLLFRVSKTALVHFGMTGSLRAFSDLPPRRKHDHVDIVLDSGVTLRYHDPRRFGAMLWLPPPAMGHPLLSKLGPEPFDPACDADYLWQATRRRNVAVKLALMDIKLRRSRHIYATNRCCGRNPADDTVHRMSKPRFSHSSGGARAVGGNAKGGSTLREYYSK